MLYLVLALSGLLLLSANLIYWKEARGVVRVLVFGACGLLLAGCGSPLVALNALLIEAAVLVCSLAGVRSRVFLVWSLAVTAACYAAFSVPSVLTLQELPRLREAYAYESLDERLAYETARPQGRGANPTEDGSDNAAARLAAVEKDLWDAAAEHDVWRRKQMLRALHETAVKNFVNSPGFGVARGVANVLPSAALLEEYGDRGGRSPIPQPGPTDRPPESGDSGPADRKPTVVRDASAEPALWEFHLESLVDFADPSDYGLAADRRRVSGFRPHHFRNTPSFAPKPDSLRWLVRYGEPGRAPRPEPPPWALQRLELVSLLKFVEPGVYVSENLPRMAELTGAPTRALDAFERDALGALRGGEDLRAAEDGGGLRVLGALRAAKQCLDCHDGGRGDLLGAFSYQFRRERGR